MHYAPRHSVKLTVAIVLLIVLCALGLDVQFSQVFFQPEVGFLLGEQAPWRWFYHAMDEAIAWSLLMCVALLASAAQWRRQISVFLIVLLLGPGLLVNTLLKPGVGRPRPVDLQQFGGIYEYVMPAVPVRPVQGYSFPSGHAAGGFALLPIALMWQGRRRRWLLAGALLLGALASMARIVAGGHFLSDVLTSYLIVFWLSVALCHRLQPRLPAPSGLDRVGRWSLSVLAVLILVIVQRGVD